MLTTMIRITETNVIARVKGGLTTRSLRQGNLDALIVAPAEATNHRGLVPDRPEHALSLRSVQRQQTLLDLLATHPDPGALVAAFLRPPLYNTAYADAFGTMYTAAYRPRAGVVDYVWPGSTWRRGFGSPDATHTVTLGRQAT